MDFIIEFLNITTPNKKNMETLDVKMNFVMKNTNNIGSSSPGLHEESLDMWLLLMLICLVQMTLKFLWTTRN
jgi:hypothetical protein